MTSPPAALGWSRSIPAADRPAAGCRGTGVRARHRSAARDRCPPGDVGDVLAARAPLVTLRVLGAVFALRHIAIFVTYVVLVAEPAPVWSW